VFFEQRKSIKNRNSEDLLFSEGGLKTTVISLVGDHGRKKKQIDRRKGGGGTSKGRRRGTEGPPHISASSGGKKSLLRERLWKTDKF